MKEIIKKIKKQLAYNKKAWWFSGKTKRRKLLERIICPSCDMGLFVDACETCRENNLMGFSKFMGNNLFWLASKVFVCTLFWMGICWMVLEGRER